MKSLSSSCLAVSPSCLVLSNATDDTPNAKAPTLIRLELVEGAWHDISVFACALGDLLARWHEQNGLPLRRIQPFFPGRWIQTLSHQIQMTPPDEMSAEQLIQAWLRAENPVPADHILLEELPTDCFEDNRWRLFSLEPIRAKKQLRIIRHQMFMASEPWEMLKTACAIHGVIVLPPKLNSQGIAQALSTDGDEPVALLDLHSSYVTLTLVRNNKLWRSHTLHAPTEVLVGNLLREVVNIWVRLPEYLQSDVHMHILDPHNRLPPSLADIAVDMGISILTGGDSDIAYRRAWQAEAVQLAARSRVNVSSV